MDQVIMTYIVVMSVTGVFQVILGIIAYQNRKVFVGTKTFVWLSAFSAIYSFGHALELTSTTMSGVMFWVVFQYIGMPFSAPATLILVLQYIGLETLVNRKTYVLFYLIPSISFILIATNDYHHLFYKATDLTYEKGTALLNITVGQWYIVHGSYTFGTLFIGALLLIWYWIKTKSKHWKQILTLIVGIILPVTASFSYLIELTPKGIDPVPVVMFLTSSMYLWAIISTHWLVVNPIAKDYIFESMRDGVIVLDMSRQVVEYNSLAIELFPSLAIGQEIQEIEAMDAKILDSLKQLKHTPIVAEIKCRKSSELNYFQVKVSPVSKRTGEIVGSIIVLIDITEHKQLQKQLQQLAYTDGLTNIYNRTYFYEKAQELVVHALEYQQSVSFVLFDIDFFKHINDQYGHACRDKAIQHVVSIGKELLGNKGIFGRYGGEEFVMCLPECTLQTAGIFANNLRKEIESRVLDSDGIKLKITASFGISSITSSNILETLDELIEKADRALYASKNNGRNQVHMAEENEMKKFTTIQYIL
ncbi:histidine kinase N-terminal 7TM domain-containing diguanylate cyclase [Niallia sp. 03133]|uniref:histidine kinase N-terminal 7TM domain-containing diguanylate cyclase n=1 Tax=Niallia sp. 03133 TaxID=3458060 RepID=UPI0040445A47